MVAFSGHSGRYEPVTAGQVQRAENRVTSTVFGQEFVGAMATVFLEFRPGIEFRIQKKQHELEGLNPSIGSAPSARWATERAYVLPQMDDD